MQPVERGQDRGVGDPPAPQQALFDVRYRLPGFGPERFHHHSFELAKHATDAGRPRLETPKGNARRTGTVCVHVG
jgi:hypothetical protein